jgi:hypothetical protein
MFNDIEKSRIAVGLWTVREKIAELPRQAVADISSILLGVNTELARQNGSRKASEMISNRKAHNRTEIKTLVSKALLVANIAKFTLRTIISHLVSRRKSLFWGRGDSPGHDAKRH